MVVSFFLSVPYGGPRIRAQAFEAAKRLLEASQAERLRGGGSGSGVIGCVLPPTQKQLDSNYNIVTCSPLNRTPNIDCCWVGAVPKVRVLGVGFRVKRFVRFMGFR